jgi:nucleotide-binding universal stress UspA family protein
LHCNQSSIIDIMKAIKNILVPTDFSATAHGALQYSKVLAQALDAEITVLHVNPYLFNASSIVIPLDTQDSETRLDEAMQDFINNDTNEDDTMMTKTAVKTKILRGESVSEIVQLSHSDDVDLIVMGNTGLQDFLTKIMGSTSLDVSNKAHCPVILIPRDAKWSPIERILYACNIESITHNMVRELADFAESFDATIHFVHICDDTQEVDNVLVDKIWAKLHENSKASFHFEVHTVYGSDTVEQLSEYAQENAINLIAFVTKHRNFWQNLVHNSVTESMAISTEIPMLVMHYDDKI